MTNQPQRHGGTEDAHVNAVTSRIIGCAIDVHRTLGPGLLEAMYERAMCIEFDDCGISYARQVRIPAVYKGRSLGDYRVDLIVGELVIVEVKCVDRLHPLVEAQLLTYLRVTGKRVGLLINFNVRLLKDGIKRLIV